MHESGLMTAKGMKNRWKGPTNRAPFGALLGHAFFVLTYSVFTKYDKYTSPLVVMHAPAMEAENMTAFSEMPIGKRNRWIAWADNHDWGQGEQTARFDEGTGELVTHCQECDASGEWSLVEARHRTPADLRAWAGY